MARAISSLPVPVSPRIRTVASVGATVSTCFKMRFSAELSPTISSKLFRLEFVLEVEFFLRQLILRLGNAAKSQSIVYRNRHLIRQLNKQVHVAGGECTLGFAAQIQSSKGPFTPQEGCEAGGLDSRVHHLRGDLL